MRLLQLCRFLAAQWQVLKSRPIFRWGILAFVVAFGVLVFVEPTFAQGAASADTTNEAANQGPGIAERMALLFAGLLQPIIGGVGKLLLSIIDAVITVMQYNGFSTSPVVSAGWAIVRDVVNMFFVIVLIVIALGTMFGLQRFQWRQMLVPLLIAAVVINFSKTIAGLMIDFGQVVMLTFANALRAVAAGNFINLLGLGEILSFSTSSDLIDAAISGEQSDINAPFELLTSSVMALFLLLVITATVLILLAILVYRIVLLWILIVLSPIAFFALGARQVSGRLGNAWNKWLSRFVCAVSIGPLLVFFLWLMLAVAGTGDLAGSEGFFTATNVQPQSNAAGLGLDIFTRANFISFVIAMGMFYAAFEASGAVCDDNVIGGLTAKAKGAPKRLAVAGAAVGAAAGAGAARLGLRGGRAVGGRAYKTGAGLASDLAQTKAGQAARADLLTKRGRARAYRNISKQTGSKRLAQITGGWADDLEKQTAAEFKEAGAPLSGASTDTKAAYLDNLAQQGKPIGPGERRKAMSAFTEALGDDKLRGKLDASGNLQKLWQDYGSDVEEAFKGDKDMSEKIKEFKSSRPDIMASGADGKIDKEKLASSIDSFDDVKKLDAAALARPEVKQFLDEFKTDQLDTDGKQKSASQLISEGKLGKAKKDAFSSGDAGIIARMNAEDFAKVSPERLASAFTGDNKEAAINLAQKKPEAAQAFLQSPDAAKLEVTAPEVHAAALASGAGIGAAGQPIDTAKLETFMKSQNALESLSDSTMGREDVQDAVLSTMPSSGAGSLQTQINAIKRNPDDAANKTKRANLEKLAARADASGDANLQKSFSNFKKQMEGVDRKVSKGRVKKGRVKAREADKAILDTNIEIGKFEKQMADLEAQIQDQLAEVRVANEDNDAPAAEDARNRARELQRQKDVAAGKIAELEREAERIAEDVKVMEERGEIVREGGEEAPSEEGEEETTA